MTEGQLDYRIQQVIADARTGGLSDETIQVRLLDAAERLARRSVLADEQRGQVWAMDPAQVVGADGLAFRAIS